MIYSWHCDRRRFTEFMNIGAPPQDLVTYRDDAVDRVALGPDELVLIWPERPRARFAFPRAIVVAEGSLSDFLAWFSTYFRQMRPLTAQSRVLTPTLARIARDATPHTNAELRAATIGLIVAEAAAYAGSRADPARLPFSVFARTLSFAYSILAQRYGSDGNWDSILLDQVMRGWVNVRDVVGQSGLPIPPAIVRDVWRIVDAASARNHQPQFATGDEQLIVAALRELRSVGAIKDPRWAALPGVAEAFRAMEGPREDRVIALEQAIRESPPPGSGSDRFRSFLLGYLASRVQPGTLEHLPLLSAAAPRESILWYGACAGMMPETKVDAYGAGLGLLLRRETERPATWLDAPDCDIALAEFALFARTAEAARFGFRVMAPSTLRIEVFPLIPVIVRLSDAGDDSSGERVAGSPQNSLFEESTTTRAEIRQLLEKIDESSKTLDAMRRRIESAFGEKPRSRRGRK